MTAITDQSKEPARIQYVLRAVLYLSPAAAIVGTTLPYLLGLRTFAILSLYATVPILVASAAYFVTNQSLAVPEIVAHPLSWRRMFLSVAVYFALLATSVLLLATTTVRPYSYYLLISLAALIVLFQILQSELKRSHVFVILVETSVLLASILWSVTLNYYYFFGRTDVFPHDRFINSLLSTHYITGAFGEYQAFPLWHVLIGFQTMLFNSTVDPLTMFFVMTGVLYGFATIAIYALARRFSFSRRIGLLASLAMCAHPFVILYGMYAIPRSITSILLLFCILSLLLGDVRGTLLYIGLVVGTAVYHTVSLPFVFVTFGCYYLVERFVHSAGKRDSATVFPVISTWELAAIPVVQLSYWAVADPALISRIVELILQNRSYGVEGGSANLSNQFVEAPINELVNYLPFGLILLFVLFAVMQKSKVGRVSRASMSVLLTALVLLAISIPGPAVLLSVISNLTPDNVLRFGQYTYPFVVIAFAAGVDSSVRTKIPIGSHRVKMAVVMLLVGSAVFLAVSNDFVASDNPLLERDDFYTFYLTESEVTSFSTITDNAETTVTGDYVTCRYIDNPGNGNCEIIQADPLRGKLHFPRNSVLILRKDELQDRPLSIYPTTEMVANPPYSNNRDSLSRRSPVWNDLYTKNRVYDSREVTAYTDS